MRGIDPINVALAFGAFIIALRALFQAAIQLLYYLPELLKLLTIEDNLKMIVGFWILIHTLLAAPFSYLYVINPSIRYFIPSLGCSEETATRIDQKIARCSMVAFIPYPSTVLHASAAVVGYLCRTSITIATLATDRIFKERRTNVVTEAKQPSLNLHAELTTEQKAAEARRCRLPGPVCESRRHQLDIKRKEVNELVKQLGEVEQRELDANGATDTERASRKLIQQRLDRTEQQLSQYSPEANNIRQLESQLAEYQKKADQARLRADKAERLLKTEVENSKWIIERKDAHARKLRGDAAHVAVVAKDRLGVMRAEIKSLKQELDEATRKNTPADIETFIAEKDTTIQFLIDAGIAVEEDRDEKMKYAETMYALLETENQNLRQQLSDSTNILQNAGNKAEICSLRDTLADAQKHIQTAKAGLTNKQARIDELENQVKKATGESNAAMAGVANQINKLTAELSAAQEKLVLGMTKEHIESITHQTEELSNQLTTAQASHTSKMNQASAIHTEQQQCIASLRSNLDASNNENTSLRQEVSRLQELHHQNAVSNANSGAIEQRLEAVQHQHQTDLNQARTLFATKDGEFKHLQDSLVVARVRISSLEKEVTEMQEYNEDHDKEVESLKEQLHKALTNEQDAIKRFTELEERRKKEATADLLRYNRLKVEYNKASRQRDNLAAGTRTDKTEALRNQLTKAADMITDRDISIMTLEEQVQGMKSNFENGHAGANTSAEDQNNQKTSPNQTQLYTTETKEKQQKALEMINRAQWLGGVNEDGSEEDAQSDTGMEMESTQAYDATNPKTQDEKKNQGEEDAEEEDEEFEAAMNQAIDESNQEYENRTAAIFKTSIEAPGVKNPFALPGPPTTASDFSAMFGRHDPVPIFGQQTANMSSPEKPVTPDSTTAKHLKSGVTFWMPTKMSPATPTPKQQQKQQNASGQEASDTPAPITGRKLKRPSTRRLSHTKEQQLQSPNPSSDAVYKPAPKNE
ncbi:uncharacterized protein ColSpa_11205 [Colletotrichum spaethianum]|uniref:Uncharacterized protein n=1 Tax=Colletotrichum spaethianum TaxID=700344 RepID=A0AA37PF32_9PEZI|nr:uncharacterized protein ColSpa_11205 [Colletotrichum spaethianum]GKT51024.1 hypothetical protein ColSpa_11205 [Colletotrichum spaethianum]